MANIYKKAAERQKITPGGANVEQEEVVELVVEEKVQPVIEEVVERSEPPVVETSDADTVLIPLDDIGANKKPKKRSSTLYLSESVLDELRKRSKKAGLSSSEYLDEVLKREFSLPKD